MYGFISLIFFIGWIIYKDNMYILASGLFAIADAVEYGFRKMRK